VLVLFNYTRYAASYPERSKKDLEIGYQISQITGLNSDVAIAPSPDRKHRR
jgi:hypothetical protein